MKKNPNKSLFYFQSISEFIKRIKLSIAIY